MSSKISWVLILAFALFISSCSENEKSVPQEKVPEKKVTYSTGTSISASAEETLIIKTGSEFQQDTLNKIFKEHYGVNSIKTEGKNIHILYNPAIITPDSIKNILKNSKIGIEE